MGLQEYIQFANDNPLCFMATVDGDQPHVRTIRLEKADETGFYFTLVITKQMYRQVCNNPKVEFCFFNYAADFGQIKQMRVTGMLEEVHDPDLLEKAYQTRKGLEPMVGRPIKPILINFRVRTGEAHFWTMMNAMREETTLEFFHF